MPNLGEKQGKAKKEEKAKEESSESEEETESGKESHAEDHKDQEEEVREEKEEEEEEEEQEKQHKEEKLNQLAKQNKQLKIKNVEMVQQLQNVTEKMLKLEQDHEERIKEMMDKMKKYEDEMHAMKTGLQQAEIEKEELLKQVQDLTVQHITENILHMPQDKQEEQGNILPLDESLKETPLKVQPLQSSMVRNLKKKDRKTKEMPEYEYPTRGRKEKKATEPAENKEEGNQKKPQQTEGSKELVDVDKVPLSQPKPEKKLVYPAKLPITKLLDKNDQDLLKKIYNLENSHGTVWFGKQEGTFVTLHDVHQVAKDGDVANNLIDSFGELLTNEQVAFNQDKNNSYFFTSLCWSLVKWGYGNMRAHLLDKYLEADLTKYRFLHFPMNSNGNTKDDAPYHWTLLVLDTENAEWRHYNFLRPREKKQDPYLKDAKQIIKYVESKCRSNLTTFTCLNSSLVSVVDSPQQRPASVDCGIVVCYIMQQIAQR